MSKYFVVGPGTVTHDNVEYSHGEQVELDERVAKPLLERGVVQEQPVENGAPAEPAAPSEPAQPSAEEVAAAAAAADGNEEVN